MRTTETNLEPILLVHEGTDRLRDLIDEGRRRGHRRGLRRPRRQPAPALGGHATRPARRDRRRARRHPGADRRRAPPLRRLPPAAAGAARPGRRRRQLPLGPRPRPARRPARPPAAGRSDPPLGGRPDHVGPAGRLGRPGRRVRHGHPDREAAFAAGGARRDADARPRSWSRTGGPGPCSRTSRTSPVDAAVLHEVLLPAWGVAEEQIGLPPQPRPGAAHHGTPARHRGRRAPADGRRGDGDRRPRRTDATQVDVLRPEARMGVVMRDLRRRLTSRRARPTASAAAHPPALSRARARRALSTSTSSRVPAPSPAR